MFPRRSLPLDTKTPQLSQRSSVISADRDSDCFNSATLKPWEKTDSRALYIEDDSICDSPSAHSFTKPLFNLLEKTSSNANDTDLFYSPKKSEDVVQGKSKTPTQVTAEDFEADDFYVDDFDIDDFNDSDIPDYFDEPSASSMLSQNRSTISAAVKEGESNKLAWDKKPVTPVSAPKPQKMYSPGKATITPKHQNIKKQATFILFFHFGGCTVLHLLTRWQ